MASAVVFLKGLWMVHVELSLRFLARIRRREELSVRAPCSGVNPQASAPATPGLS